MTPLDKLADKIIIAALLAALLYMSFSKPIIVSGNEKLVKEINTAFAQMDSRIKAIETKAEPQ